MQIVQKVPINVVDAGRGNYRLEKPLEVKEGRDFKT
jgi:hypothetical protein